MTEASQMPNTEIVEMILELGRIRGRETGLDPEAFNRATDALLPLRKELERRGIEAQRELLPHLRNPLAAVRLTVANICVDFAPDEAFAVLDALADLPPMVNPSESMKAKLDAKLHRARLWNRANPDAQKNWWEF